MIARLFYEAVPETQEIIETGIDLADALKRFKMVNKKADSNQNKDKEYDHYDYQDTAYWEYSQTFAILMTIVAICKVIHSLRKVIRKTTQKAFTNSQRPTEMQNLYPKV